MFHTTLWSFPDFTRIPSDALRSLDVNLLTAQVSELFISIERTFFDQGVFSFLGYSEPGFLTEFIDHHEAKIVSIQFSKFFESPNTTEYPHILIVDIFLCDKETDFATLHRNTACHDGASTTFELL